jgi:hypothetical protein
MDTVHFLNLEYIYLRIFDFFKNFDLIAILNAIINIIEKLMPISFVITAFLVYVIIYCTMKLKKIAEAEEKAFKALSVKETQIKTANDPELHEKWLKIQEHINSTNSSDWRLAILEADIMLSDILDKLGYQGDSIGEKLKGIKKEDFLTLDDAWEAHKVRNDIAHKGADFDLSEREAKRIIGLFKKVFEEFYTI